MKNTIGRKAMKIGAILCAVLVLLIGITVPVSANFTTSPAAIQTVQGKVNSVTPSISFVIQNGNQAPITIYVDQNTLYFAIPRGKSLNSLNNNDNKDEKQNRNKQLLPGNKRGISIPSNWRSDLRWLSIFDIQADFSSIEVGDIIIARIQTADNLAKQVLIIKVPAIQRLMGTITGVGDDTITITPTSGSPVTVTWDSKTKVSITGQIAVQVNQYAIVVYNRTNMIALTINAKVATTAPTNVMLTSIAVTPASPASLLLGMTQQYTAIGTYSDGTNKNITTQVTWASSNTSVATISASGLATGVAVGSTNITASLSGVTSPAVALDVVNATLSSITVTPSPSATITAALSQQYTAIGTYSNGTHQNITTQVTWYSSNTSVATISATGLATGASVGSTYIAASLSGVTSPAVTLNVIAPALTSITITPALPANLPIGLSQQFTATGSYSNGATQDITSAVTWASSNTSIATISAAGLATGVAVGNTNVTASLSGITSPSVNLNVMAPVLISIAVSPAPSANLYVADTQQFIAIGTYSDGATEDITAAVTWASSNTSVATISASGLATGVAVGSTNITASLSGVTNPAVTLNVVTP